MGDDGVILFLSAPGGGELENTVQQGSIWRNEIKCINLDAYLRTTMWVAKQTTFGLVRIFGLAERMKRL